MQANPLETSKAIRPTNRVQFHGVFVKNTSLLLKSWCGTFWIFITAGMLMGVLIVMHVFYLDAYTPPPDKPDDNTTIISKANMMPYASTTPDLINTILYRNINGTLGTLGTTTASGTGYLGLIDVPFYDSAFTYRFRRSTDRLNISNQTFSLVEPNFLPQERIGIESSKVCPVQVDVDVSTQSPAASHYACNPANTCLQAVFDVVQQHFEVYRDANFTTPDDSLLYKYTELLQGYIDFNQYAFDLGASPEPGPEPGSGPEPVTANNNGQPLLIHDGYVHLFNAYRLYTYVQRQVFFLPQPNFKTLLSIQFMNYNAHLRAVLEQIVAESVRVFGRQEDTWNQDPAAPAHLLYGPVVNGFYKHFWTSLAPNVVGPDNFTPMFAAFTIPFMMLLLLPSFAFSRSQDRGEGINHMHQMMGLRYRNRWLADFAFEFLLELAMIAMIAVMCYAGDLRGLSHTSPVVWLIALLLMAASVPVLASFVSAFFESGRNSSVLSLIVAVAMAGGALTFGLTFSDTTLVDRSINPLLSLVPGFGPVAMMAMIQGLAILQNEDYYLQPHHLGFTLQSETNAEGVSIHTPPCYVGRSFTFSIVYSVVATAALALLSIYLDLVWPFRKMGVAEHWLFFCRGLVARADALRGRRTAFFTTRSVCSALAYLACHPRGCCRRLDSLPPVPDLLQGAVHDAPRGRRGGRRDKGKDGQRGREAGGDSTDSSRLNSDHDAGYSAGQPAAADPFGDQETTFDYLNARPLHLQARDGADLQGSVSTTMMSDQGPRVSRVSKLTQRDPDIVAERHRAINNLPNPDVAAADSGAETLPLVRAINLVKSFPATRLAPEKHAVRNVSFTISENECLCLLGPNGAAKTTTINMLTMLLKPTSGTAYISGMNISDPVNSEALKSSIGICPQFDILFPTLSVEQHLRFICRIKGLHKADMRAHIDALLAAVNLLPQRAVPSKSLSGGMKRRLSVAMALCGNPRVIFFDEPSSGLDPGSRRLLWNIILAVRPGRAILLTTHAMEEAQALCTRVGIMAVGKLRCIGTVAHLNRRFGSGYELEIHVDTHSHSNVNRRVIAGSNDEESVTAAPRSLSEAQEVAAPFLSTAVGRTADAVSIGGVMLATALEQYAHDNVIRNVSGNLRLRSAYGGHLKYKIPGGVKISNLFLKMEMQMKLKSNIICDWSLAQSSLDTIFLNVVNESY